MSNGVFQVSLIPSKTEYFIQPAPRSSWKQHKQDPTQGLLSNCSHLPDHILSWESPHSLLPSRSNHTINVGISRKTIACQEQELPWHISTETSRLKEKDPSWQHKLLGKYQPSARWFGNICMQSNKQSNRDPGNAKLMQQAQEAPALCAQMNWTQQKLGSCGCNVQLLTSPENRPHSPPRQQHIPLFCSCRTKPADMRWPALSSPLLLLGVDLQTM